MSTSLSTPPSLGSDDWTVLPSDKDSWIEVTGVLGRPIWFNEDSLTLSPSRPVALVTSSTG